MPHLEEIVDSKVRTLSEYTSIQTEGVDEEVPIGIDLGTTNSSAAFFSLLSKSLEVIPLETGLIRNRMPSVVWYDQKNDRLVVGDSAKRVAILHPEAVRAEFKLDMPKASAVVFHLGDATVGPVREETPQSLTAIVLKEIKTRSERHLSAQLGKRVRIRRAVITVPASFPEGALVATMAGAREAGFVDIQLLDEPTAAALAYSLHVGAEHGRIVVFDFGGGTLDCSVLTSPGDNGKPFKVTNPIGDPELGGKCFDDLLIEILAKHVRAGSRRNAEDSAFDLLSTTGLGISTKKRELWNARLKEEAERIKIELGELPTSEYVISSDRLVDYDDSPLEIAGEVARGEFETLARPLISRAIEVLRRTLAEAEMAPEDVDRLVLVGGTTLIPSVEVAIARELGLKPYRNVDRLTAVAQGAAIYEVLTRPVPPPPGVARNGTDGFGEFSHDTFGIDLLASHNFGVRYGLDLLDTLIFKNDPLPTSSVTRTYIPRHPDSEEVVVPLYQYDNSLIRGVTVGEPIVIHDSDIDERRAFEIGRVRVDALRGPNRAIDVTFGMDRNRILSIVVRRQSDGIEFPLRIERIY